jgi:ferric enterobactin receptor
LQYKETFSFLTSSTFGALNIAAQKSILQKRGSIKINCSDILFTNNIRGSSVFSNYNDAFRVKSDTRIVGLTFTYRYGKTTVPPLQRKEGGASEEKQRAKNV